MKVFSDMAVSHSLREQAANAFRRARKLPPGPHRNDLRHLGRELLWLYKENSDTSAQQSANAQGDYKQRAAP
jgi:hypothetical protein